MSLEKALPLILYVQSPSFSKIKCNSSCWLLRDVACAGFTISTQNELSLPCALKLRGRTKSIAEAPSWWKNEPQNLSWGPSHGKPALPMLDARTTQQTHFKDAAVVMASETAPD